MWWGATGGGTADEAGTGVDILRSRRQPGGWDAGLLSDKTVPPLWPYVRWRVACVEVCSLLQPWTAKVR